MLCSVTPSEAYKTLSQGDFSFIAAISFEERATAWAKALANQAMVPRRSLLFDYTTIAEPAGEDRARREACRSTFEEALGQTLNPCSGIRVVNPFAMNPLVTEMQATFQAASEQAFVIDISCMTRVHLFATVAALFSTGLSPAKVWFCYTVPAAYGFHPDERFAWKDVLFVPIGCRRMFKREGFARGVILAGHDGERLAVALQELEPASGSLIYSGSKRRPDFALRAREANVVIERRLLELRMPRADANDLPHDGWKTLQLESGDFLGLAAAIHDQVHAAMTEDGPIVFYPFGPKPMTLSMALSIQDWGVLEAWAVYPIPERFSVSYSRGVSELQAFQYSRDST